MTGFNINTSKWLKKLRSDKKFKYKLTSRYVFSPFAFVLPQLSSIFFIDSEIYKTIPIQFPRFFSFFYEKKPTLLGLFFRMFAKQLAMRGHCKLQVHKNRRKFWRETHTPLWLLIGRIIFFTREKISFAILIGRIAFFTCEKHRSLLWLPRTHFHMNLRHSLYIIEHWNFLSSESEATSSQNYRNTAWGLRGVCGPHNLAELGINNRAVNLEHLTYPRIFGVYPHA